MTSARPIAPLAAPISRRMLAALAAVMRWSMRRRTIVVAVCVRLAWLLALVLFVRTGELLLGAAAGLHVDEARAYALLGALLCTLAVALGESRRVRWSAWILGVAHAAAWMLAWTASAA
jgi:hypothetical protein